MTMIRINLIAERKPGSQKAAKKTSRQSNELQDNLILIVLVALAVGMVVLMWQMVSRQLDRENAENRRLRAEWKKVEKYQEKKDRLELRKELLNEKIQKISELKDRREGPVKLMEDIHNALPEAVWLQSVEQWYDKNLALPTRSEGQVKEIGEGMSQPAMVRVAGFAKTPDAVTNFASRILALDKRYTDTELNHWQKQKNDREGVTTKEYQFTIFFKVRKGETVTEDGG